MLSALPQGCIPANPDIAGIGIRASTYIQNFVGIFLATCYIMDGEISPDEAEYMETAGNANLMTACAIIISAFIQAKTIGLSAYHAMIVLNLSRMNTTYLTVCGIFTNVGTRPEKERRRLDTRYPGSFWVRRRETKVSLGNITFAIVLGYAYLSLMGGFGIWLWQDIDTFGASSECTPYIFTVIFGHNVSAMNKSLRAVSFAWYWSMAIPLVNIVANLPIILVVFVTGSVVFLSIHIVVVLPILITRRLFYLWYLNRRHPTDSSANNNDAVDATPILDSSLLSGSLLRDDRLRLSPLLMVLFFDVLFAIDNELMIRRSRPLVQPGESQWTFGQTLAVILTIIPILEARKCITRRSHKCVS